MAEGDSSEAVEAAPPDGKLSFDIVTAYRSLLASDPDLTMPVAAIEALVALLAATPSLTTVSETLDLLADAAAKLKRAVPNPISLSAGTDLFTRYIVTCLRTGAIPGGLAPTPPGTSAGGPAASRGAPPPFSGSGGGRNQDADAFSTSFQAVRQHLLSNGRLFAARAKDARRLIGASARRFVRRNDTVLTNGGSRVVGAVLRAAAAEQTREWGAPRFRVVWVSSPALPAEERGGGSGGGGENGKVKDGEAGNEGAETIAALRALQVPVAEIPASAVAYGMGAVTMALVGAEGVVESGGIVSRLGTYQLAALAKLQARPVYVVAESHKFVRMFPLGQEDLGVGQQVVEFKTAAGTVGRGEQLCRKGAGEGALGDAPVLGLSESVDYTPPDLITALITEAGVLTPSAVSEELIKIWY